MAREIADPISTAIAVPNRRQRKPAEEAKSERRPKRRQAVEVPPAGPQTDSAVAPPIVDSFGEAILAAQMYPAPISAREHQLRVAAGWTPPASNLRLRDRSV